MMKKILLLVLISFVNFSYAQIDSLSGIVQHGPQPKYDETKNSQQIIDKSPEFPGGTTKFRELIAKNVDTKKVKGSDVVKCELKFFIEKDGSISDIKTIGSNSDFNREVVNAVSKIKKKWQPAESKGEKIRYQYRIPVTMIF